MPTVVRFDPYRISSDLELRASDPFDPTQEDLTFRWQVRGGPEDGLSLTFDLSGPDIPWKQLHINLNATLSRTELEAVLPRGVDLDEAAAETRLLVSARCPAARYRHTVELEPRGIGSWTGGLHLRRDSVRNVVELHPVLVRRTHVPSGPGAQSEVALERGAVIAEGRAIRLIVDRSEPPLRGALNIQWEDFRESQHPWRQEHASDVYYLDLDGREPQVWLNSRYAALKAALHGREPHGPEAVVRHLANGLIAQAAWLQMAVAAVGAVEYDRDLGTLEVRSGWAPAVLESLLPRLFPELTDDDRLKEAAARFHSPDQVSSLVSALGTLVQENLPTYKRIEDAIAAAERAR